MIKKSFTHSMPHPRKKMGEYVMPGYTVNGPPIEEFNKRMERDPLLERLREIGAPMYEDMRLRR